MRVRDFAYSRGREIGAVADTEDELQELVTAFMRGHPEIAGNPRMVKRVWQGVATTHPDAATHPPRITRTH